MPAKLESDCDEQLGARQESLRVATQLATSRALRWFAGALDAGMKGFDFEATCTALFGVCCALRVCSHPPGSVVSSELRERLISALLDNWNLRTSETVERFRRGAFIPALMAAASLDVTSPQGDRYSEIIVQQWEGLKNHRGLDTTSVSYWTAEYLASLLAKRPSPPPPELIAGPWLLPFFRYTATPGQIQHITQQIAAASTFGNSAFTVRDECRHPLEELLLFWAFYFAKERDLDMICPVLRSLEYLGCTSAPEFADGLDVVVLQCKRDGRFGVHEMAARLYGLGLGEQLNCDREIYLPLTVAGVWTLLECTRPDLSPFRNAKRHDSSRRSHS
jgi:hypothetical protein